MFLAAGLGLFVARPALGQRQMHANLGVPAMKIRDLYPLITTPALAEACDFYVTHFDFQVAFEASWFVYLTGSGEDGTRGATLAFMHPDHPSNPSGPEAFGGLGMILTVETSDAASLFERLQRGGAPIVYPLTEEDWGQRRLMTRDPAGILVDVVEQIEPAAGFWVNTWSRNEPADAGEPRSWVSGLLMRRHPPTSFTLDVDGQAVDRLGGWLIVPSGIGVIRHQAGPGRDLKRRLGRERDLGPVTARERSRRGSPRLPHRGRCGRCRER